MSKGSKDRCDNCSKLPVYELDADNGSDDVCLCPEYVLAVWEDDDFDTYVFTSDRKLVTNKRLGRTSKELYEAGQRMLAKLFKKDSN